MSKSKSFDQALREAGQALESAGVPEAELNAWYLMEEATGKTKSWFLLHREEEIPEEADDKLVSLVEHRKKRVPLEYLIHRAEFMGLTFTVDGRVLIPRQDTECLVEEALKYTKDADVLDLCTGSGCIAVSLAVLGAPRSVTATDVSTEALAVAKENAKANGAGEKHVAIDFLQGDLWEALGDSVIGGSSDGTSSVGDSPAGEQHRYDLITCNPPYIRRDVIPTLMPEVQEYEPVLALDGGEDGLDYYRRLMDGVGTFLRENGHIICEIGYDQGEDVAELMREAGLVDVMVKQDLAGLDRIVIGRK